MLLNALYCETCCTGEQQFTGLQKQYFEEASSRHQQKGTGTVLMRFNMTIVNNKPIPYRYRMYSYLVYLPD
jgi:hypothetical protein